MSTYIYIYNISISLCVQAAEAALLSHFVASAQKMSPSSARPPSGGPYSHTTGKKRGRTSLSAPLYPVIEKDIFDGCSSRPQAATAAATEAGPSRVKRSRATNEESFVVGNSIPA